MELLLLFIGGILFTGLLFGKLARFVHLPNVTGYLVGGVVFALILKLFKIDDDWALLLFQLVLNLNSHILKLLV